MSYTGQLNAVPGTTNDGQQTAVMANNKETSGINFEHTS
jgi:hypothetical protein